MRLTQAISVFMLLLMNTGFGAAGVRGRDNQARDGGAPGPSVTLEYPTSAKEWYGGRVKGHVDAGDGMVDRVTVTATSGAGSATLEASLDADGNFDVAFYMYGLGPKTTLTAQVFDDAGASGSDSTTVHQGCGGFESPAYLDQKPPNWEGDVLACGYQSSVGWLDNPEEKGGSYTRVVRGPSPGWFRARPDDGSVRIFGGSPGANFEHLSSLQSIRKDLIVHFSSWPRTMDALPTGLRVGGDIVLHFDYYLRDVSGLLNLDVSASSPSSIVLTHNDRLPTCHAQWVIGQLRARGWRGEALIYANGAELSEAENQDCQ